MTTSLPPAHDAAAAKRRHIKTRGAVAPRASEVRPGTKNELSGKHRSEEERHIGELLAAVREDPSAHIYGISALVAAADGITTMESRALATVCRHLHVATSTRKRIDAACRTLLATNKGLEALLEAYAEPSPQPALRVNPGAIEIIREQAEARILELPMFDASEVSVRLGSRSSNQRQYAAILRERGEVMGLRRGNRFVYPAFQFDLKRGCVYPEIAEVGRILDAKADPWGVVGWWMSPSPRLPRDRAPADLLGTPDAHDLLLLARSMVNDVG